MNCEQVEKRLIEFLDGKLPARQREAVELHARDCSLCADRINAIAEVSHLLETWEAIEPSPSFNVRLQQRLEQEGSRSDWWADLFPRIMPALAGNPVFALSILAMISVAAVLIGYSPTAPEELARRQSEPFIAIAQNASEDLALYQDLPVLEDFDVLRNFEVLQELNSPSPLHQ